MGRGTLKLSRWRMEGPEPPSSWVCCGWCFASRRASLLLGLEGAVYTPQEGRTSGRLGEMGVARQWNVPLTQAVAAGRL